MPRALIISENEENIALIASALRAEWSHVVVKNTTLARIVLEDTGFDAIFIDTADRVRFCRECARGGATLVSVGDAKALSSYGVYEIPEGNEVLVKACVLWLEATLFRLDGLKRENTKLQKKLEDLALIGRAKSVLMRTFGMTEDQAHKHIEKQAMDLRLTKSEIARRLLSTYEN